MQMWHNVLSDVGVKVLGAPIIYDRVRIPSHVHQVYPVYMAIHIQDPETDRLARELSLITGLSITQAVNMALQDKLESVARAPHRSKKEYIDGIEAIVQELNQLPVLDTRTPDEIIGYNEHGSFD